jgi:hypothetical protein
MQIVLILIAVLTIVGAWIGWRRSPLYSVKITLKLAGAFLLIVAAMVAVLMAILKGPISQSPAALAISLVVAAMVLAMGASVILIRITDRHVAQLPPSVQLVTIHRRKVQRWMWRAVVFLLIDGGAAVAVPGAWKGVPIVLGVIVLLLCGTLLSIGYMMARRNDRGMSAVMAGPWAHWQYTPAQWDGWAKHQLAWERSKLTPIIWRRDWFKQLKLVLVMALLFGGCSLLVVNLSIREKAAVTAMCSVLVMGIMSCANWANRSACDRRYGRLLAVPPEVYFGAEGLFCNGEYSPWILSGSYLLEATARRDPPARLELVFQSFNGSSSVRVAKRIPIPEGRESDLALLQQKLRACCPKAAVRLVAPAQ